MPDITCKPIDTLEGVFVYLDSPPTWAAKCLKYRPTSRRMLRNCDLHLGATMECPRYFCHYELGKEVVCERYEKSLLPRTLVCHDMANGYHDDSYVDGTTNSEAYNFYNWAAVDIFCYFSHHFITIPPLAWINAAHRHDVRVLGTLITEWSDGVTKWEQILSSPEYYRKFADSLVAITKYLRFEGWLLNVENKIAKPQALLDFVKYFREQLHKEIPGAELLWYDSVTIKGDLVWQNALNGMNIDFFRACDGIFTNYSWKEEHVRSSAALASSEGRILDVYVGIDVWGRNFYGGGQFNTAQAVKVAFKHGCSLAIFAQAWTYEAVEENEEYSTLGEEVGYGRVFPKYTQFLLRERAFWDTLWPYLNTRIPAELPFKTSFCRGNGTKQWRYGEEISEDSWHNMAVIQYQPSANHGPHGYRLVDMTEPSTTKTSPQSGTELAPMEAKGKNLFQRIKRVFKQTYKVNNKRLKNIVKVDAVVTENIEAEVGTSVGEPIPENKEDREVIPRTEKTVIGETVALSSARADNPQVVTAVAPKAGAVVRYKLALVRDERPCLSQYAEDAFNGGSCMMVTPSVDRSAAILLFHCEFMCANKLIVHVVTKTLDNKEQSLEIICTMHERASRKNVDVTLKVKDIACSDPVLNSLENRTEFPVHATQLNNVQKYLLIDKKREYVPIENGCNWDVRYFVLDYPGTVMTCISCRTSTPDGPILLGQIGVCPMEY